MRNGSTKKVFDTMKVYKKYKSIVVSVLSGNLSIKCIPSDNDCSAK